MIPTASTIRPWYAVLLYAAFTFLLSVPLSPANAHCDGVKHAPGHPHCDSGDGGSGGDGGTPAPELVWISGDGIEVANGDGSDVRLVLSDKTGNPASSPSWAPGGMEILYRLEDDSNVVGGLYRLPLFDGQTDADKPRGNFVIGEPSLVLATPVGDPRWSPVPAPDEKYWIAYVGQGGGVFLIDPANPEDPPVTLMDDDTDRLAVALTWAPAGDRIAVHTLRPIGDSEDEDIVIFTLSEVGGTLESDSGVSLLLNNESITDPDTNAGLLKSDLVLIFSLDWANKSDRLVVDTLGDTLGSGSRLWILPVPVDDPLTEESETQDAVADGTELISIDNAEESVSADSVGRRWPRWSPNDDALVYRRLDAGGVCNIQSSKKGRAGANPRNIVIASLTPVDPGAPDGLQQKINCSDEDTQSSQGHAPEWWRGALPDGVAPPPLP